MQPFRSRPLNGSARTNSTVPWEVTMLTIILIILVLMLLFGGFGFSRRGRA